MSWEAEWKQFYASDSGPTPRYGKNPFPKSAKRCKRCKMPSELQFCIVCQTEFVTQARLCFTTVMDAIAIQEEPNRAYEEKRAAYKAAKRRFKGLLELKSYGVTFEQTPYFRKELRRLRERLKEEKAIAASVAADTAEQKTAAHRQ
ncbi:hypothetical protein Heshes_20870 [Alicyclobacillus hesperidum]|uniref:Uncharacterized protein n=1 Tax=Alicyclobacillus hesperidum TaxID=89784 RepID=A0A1H2UKV6_9BACL|nr:hypothetical protein [Alicyclobacillus hesperidum]GLV14403.1 hypothetical protein Heshes_20870 [Alicyclobacillus hesperidum]SDW56229.1 hypothetical protein SAMN04489725_10820 [Alicyclobacillus hesperidum]